MVQTEFHGNVIPMRRGTAPADLGDLRFRNLVGRAAWDRLPEAVRVRFSKRLSEGKAAIYVGDIIAAERNWPGAVLAQLCRLIGGPLPLDAVANMPAIVTVTEDLATRGQHWTRIYERPKGFPQVIRSSKRFAGPTGLEEHLGFGFGMALRVEADAHALHFHSDHYFWKLGKLRLRLPRFLSPGALTISHVDCDDGWFAFDLVLRHRFFGSLMRQTAMFRDQH